jgi:hypothetical protein
MNSVDVEQDYDSGRYSVLVNFEVKLALPHNIVITDVYEIKDIIPIINIENQVDENKTIFTEINDIDQFIDENKKQSILINPKQLDFTNIQIVISKEEMEKVGISETDINGTFPKTILFVDSDYSKTKEKTQYAFRIQSSFITEDGDNYIINLSQWQEELNKLNHDQTNKMLVILNRFD